MKVKMNVYLQDINMIDAMMFVRFLFSLFNPIKGRGFLLVFFFFFNANEANVFYMNYQVANNFF